MLIVRFLEERSSLRLPRQHSALDAALVDYYAGSYSSACKFAEQITEETTEISQNLMFYIDYERMARDLVINDVFTVESGGSVHIFWSH